MVSALDSDSKDLGSNPGNAFLFVFAHCAVVAQLGERSTEDAEVGCSIHPDGKSRGRARAVNGIDSKSTGLCPRAFESRRPLLRFEADIVSSLV